MRDSSDDGTDPPDWFGADGDTGDGHLEPEAPEGADWFDDLTHLDPTPDDAPGTGTVGRTTDTGGGAGSSSPGTESSTPEAGSDATSRAAGPGTTADTGTTAGGTGGTSTERDTGREVFRDEQGRQVRRPADPEAESGGIIAWLKRLLGLN